MVSCELEGMLARRVQGLVHRRASEAKSTEGTDTHWQVDWHRQQEGTELSAARIGL